MRAGHPDRQQRRFERRAEDLRRGHAMNSAPPITAAERAEFCGCKQPEQHSDGNDLDGRQ